MAQQFAVLVIHPEEMKTYFCTKNLYINIHRNFSHGRNCHWCVISPLTISEESLGWFHNFLCHSPCSLRICRPSSPGKAYQEKP